MSEDIGDHGVIVCCWLLLNPFQFSSILLHGKTCQSDPHLGVERSVFEMFPGEYLLFSSDIKTIM